MRKLVLLENEDQVNYYKKVMYREDLKVGDSITIIKVENSVIYDKVYIDLNSGLDPLLIADINNRYYPALRALVDL